MPTVFTIQGHDDDEGGRCKRVRVGKRGSGCTQLVCAPKSGRGRWKFKKDTRRCER